MKKINDEGWHKKKGHEAGDLYLKTFAEKITNHIRLYDVLARWGGDEFVLLFPNTTASEAETIILRVYKKFPNFSWGISEWNKRDSLKLLIGKADDAVYCKKKRRIGKKAEKAKIFNPVGKPRL